MIDLSNKRVVVCGGTGEVGEGIVKALIAHGAHVALPARSPDKAAHLQNVVTDAARLDIHLGATGDLDGSMSIASEIAAAGPIDAVVASLGGWWQGERLLDVDQAVWSGMLANNLTSHFIAARAYMPLLKGRDGVYVQVLGAAAESAITGSSLVSITAAAATMLGRALAAERKPEEATLRQLMIASVVATRSRPRAEPGGGDGDRRRRSHRDHDLARRRWPPNGALGAGGGVNAAKRAPTSPSETGVRHEP